MARRLLLVHADGRADGHLRDCIGAAGYWMREAKGAAQAARLAVSFRPQVAVLEVPTESAPALVEVCRLHAGVVCVLVVSASDTGSVVPALEAGAHTWLRKPFHEGELLHEVRRCFDLVDLAARAKRGDASGGTDIARFADFAGRHFDRLWEMDEHLRFTYVLDRQLAAEVPSFYGATRWEAAGVDDPDRDEHWRAHKADLEAHRPFEDFRYRGADDAGRPVYWCVSGHPVFDEEDRFRGYRGTGQNETEVLAVQERFLWTIDHLPVRMALFDADDRLVFMCASLREHYARRGIHFRLGMSFEQMMRELLASGQVEGAGGREEAWLDDRLAKHRHPAGPFDLALPGGEWAEVHEQRAADGSTLFVSVDITARKKAEQRLLEKSGAAQSASRHKSQFLERLSHELRAPLNSVLGYAQLLEWDGSPTLSAHQIEHVGVILASGRHLLDLVEDVLDLERIEAGHLELELEPVDAAGVCAECAQMARSLPGAGQVEVIVEARTGDEVLVQADWLRLKQAVLNLLSNALKFTPAGGTVIVACHRMPSGAVCIDVSDSGPGIPRDKVEEIFEPFTRLGTAGTPIPGTGLGLAITRSLVKLMGGKVGVASDPGAGSLFWIELDAASSSAPRARAAHAGRDPPESRAASPGRYCVLHVEDDAANRMLVREMLRHARDIELIDAECAERGLALAREHMPDLILMDIDLPGMDGFQALHQLRADPRTRDIPVVAVTAKAMPRDIAEGRAAGFADYLTKPIDFNALIHVVETLLARTR